MRPQLPRDERHVGTVSSQLRQAGRACFFAVAHDHAVGLQQSADQWPPGLAERWHAEQHAGATVREQVLQLFGGQHDVRRDGHRADLLRGEVGDREAGDVGQEEQDAIAGLDAQADQPVGGAIDLALQLGVGERLAFEEDGRLVGEVAGGPFQVLRDVHGIVGP
jgi:hypothetical protein